MPASKSPRFAIAVSRHRDHDRPDIDLAVRVVVIQAL